MQGEHEAFSKTQTTGPMELVLVKCYGRKSGKQVSRASRVFHVHPDDLLVVHSELWKKVGRFGFAAGIAFRGNVALQDVGDALEYDDFTRLGIGIGRPSRDAIMEHIVAPFSRMERAKLRKVFRMVAPRLVGGLGPMPESYLGNYSVTWELGDFLRIGRQLGQGHFGEVFSARDEKRGTKVVVKVLKNAEAEYRLLREIRILRKLQGGTNVVQA